jgi:hypothetical protein
MNVLEELALAQAADALSKSDLDGCLEWLERVPVAERPPALLGEIHDKRSRNAATAGHWSEATAEAVAACGACRTPVRQERVELLRKRSPLMADREWNAMATAVDAALRLDSELLIPEIDKVYACGAYISRGAGSGAPWSRFLRMGKAPSDDERSAVLSLAGGFFSRFLVERTPLTVSGSRGSDPREPNSLCGTDDEPSRRIGECSRCCVRASCDCWGTGVDGRR